MQYGDEGERDTPVPIPNTEVKPLIADGTWLETTWESRSLPNHLEDLLSSNALLAQSVEHAAVNRAVAGSSPAQGVCRGGGIGRRKGLKIPRLYNNRTGSTPVLGI